MTTLSGPRRVWSYRMKAARRRYLSYVLILLVGCSIQPSESPSPPQTPRVTASPSSTPSSPGPASDQVDLNELSGRLAFWSSTEGSDDIWILSLGGRGVPEATRLTESGPDEANASPSWSPNGTRIAFQHREGTDVSVYTMKADAAIGS